MPCPSKLSVFLFTDSHRQREKQTMDKSGLRLVSPTKVNRTVTPTRRPNAELRPREHLTEIEIDKLIAAAKGNRWGHRDAAMILIAFMVYVPPNSASCNGAMWSLRLPPSTCAGPRVARPAHTHC